MPLLVPTHWMNEALFPTLISLALGVWVPGTPQAPAFHCFHTSGPAPSPLQGSCTGVPGVQFLELVGTDFECLLPGS